MKNRFNLIVCVIALWVTGYFWHLAVNSLARIENADQKDLKYLPVTRKAVQSDINIMIASSLILGYSTCTLLGGRKKNEGDK